MSAQKWINVFRQKFSLTRPVRYPLIIEEYNKCFLDHFLSSLKIKFPNKMLISNPMNYDTRLKTNFYLMKIFCAILQKIKKTLPNYLVTKN
ncbi:hypothetical protein BpHYR1_037790 [Brachionus plicatilis]|uniref:Uncharacterized protein n=1 Tax=Brachionus plicatilis TaxID=10195 RepID=A0A3M7PA99_BRAPC|nr:hypothetical protein BpHYR1_037790 [Brachionus plicatilis]